MSGRCLHAPLRCGAGNHESTAEAALEWTTHRRSFRTCRTGPASTSAAPTEGLTLCESALLSLWIVARRVPHHRRPSGTTTWTGLRFTPPLMPVVTFQHMPAARTMHAGFRYSPSPAAGFRCWAAEARSEHVGGCYRFEGHGGQAATMVVMQDSDRRSHDWPKRSGNPSSNCVRSRLTFH